MCRRIWIGVGLVWLFAGVEASAGFDYRFEFDQPLYQVSPGGSVDVQVFLQEVVSGGDSSILASDGLVGAGVRVAFDIAPLPSDSAQVLSIGDILPNIASFDDSFGPLTTLVPGSYAEFTETVDLLSPTVLGAAMSTDTYRIFLGTIRFTGGLISGQVTTIQATDIVGTSDTITGANLVLDSLIQSSEATITVSGAISVPEPTSIFILSTGILGLLFGTKARRVLMNSSVTLFKL